MKNYEKKKDGLQSMFDRIHEMTHPELNLTTGTDWSISYRLDQDRTVNSTRINARTAGDAIEELREDNEGKKLIILSILPAPKK